MKIPGPTIRQLMIATAIVATILALTVRFPAWAERRRARIAAIGFRYACVYGELVRQGPSDARQLAYYDAMRKKYYHAAQHPWLPVWPDPPEPR